MFPHTLQAQYHPIIAPVIFPASQSNPFNNSSRFQFFSLTKIQISPFKIANYFLSKSLFSSHNFPPNILFAAFLHPTSIPIPSSLAAHFHPSALFRHENQLQPTTILTLPTPINPECYPISQSALISCPIIIIRIVESSNEDQL
jgi:hypothetical protein